MELREILEITIVLASLIVPPILFARIFLWARTRWRQKSKPRRMVVYIASFAVWSSVLVASVYTFYSETETSPECPPSPVWQSPLDSQRRMPRFPWPPPPASAETMIPRNWLSTTVASRLADIADKLERALKEAKYPKWSYFSIPNGFALVSQMEQIKSDGTPSPEPERWSTDLPSVANMTLLEFIKALANAQPGFYRVIVFVVTDEPWTRTSEKPTGKEAELWLAEGFNWLPRSIAELTYGPDYRTMALVYEFRKVSQGADAALIQNCPTSAVDHLEKAGISRPLSQS